MIEFEGVYKAYKSKSVLYDINMEIRSDEIFVLIGSSGCGKTTLLKMINKLISFDRGDIRIDGESINKISGTLLRRKIGYVVQDGGLFPHMTIGENIGVIPKMLKQPQAQIEQRVDELLRMVNLEPNLYRDLYPAQLSGGQKQRVGVARAFSVNPDIILMDEPFSALDPVTRNELQDEIYNLQHQFHKTIVFVTHDMDEAIRLADRICIIQDGRIVQLDTPEQVLRHPASSYVEQFVGKNRIWSSPEFIKAGDIMEVDPCRISRGRTAIQAVQSMNHRKVDSALVTEGRKLVGIVRLKDLRNFKDYTIPLEHFISEDYRTVYEDDSLQDIINTIDYNQSGIIPVITHEDELVGYLTKSSLLATLSKQYMDEGEEGMLGV
ncbi:ABC transporter ATP-binding protein [Christensenellaceae bacterium NSJ-44]|uniref:Quaternary amine transport ATP-binding protein n=1 Tax=Luoshenia tenuis TaxID=2763654 RepID=A0A926D0C1_9FIRM|nr:ABC transporter ATP-binding protein [Luoshenia tenuis]MBC8528644.1 ABC transporter ATP-binding protein [Luoshenia tenuis]SCJ61069.1 Glycine betaine/L-proline transport ATP-binding protein ProV [uncultured Clostridium sp.]